MNLPKYSPYITLIYKCRLLRTNFIYYLKVLFDRKCFSVLIFHVSFERFVECIPGFFFSNLVSPSVDISPYLTISFLHLHVSIHVQVFLS